MKAERIALASSIGLVAIWCIGCGSHASLASPAGMMNAGQLLADGPSTAADAEIARLLDTKVRMKLPTTLAVAKLSRSFFGSSNLELISGEDLAGWAELVDGHSAVNGVQPIPAILMAGGPDRKASPLVALRLAAARMHSELLLVYAQADSQVNNYNHAAALYWTFIGLWIVPGNVVEHRTIMQGLLMHTRTGAVLATMTGSRDRERYSPAAFAAIAEDALREQTPAEALEGLRKAFKSVLPAVLAGQPGNG